MNTTWTEFERRVSEIDGYFDFLKSIDRQEAKLKIPVRLGSKVTKEELIEDSTKVVLKASAFLLLYNLIESTTERILVTVFESIQTENATYLAVTGEVQKLWREEKLHQFQNANVQTISGPIHDLVMEVVDSKVLVFDITKARRLYQGNIDAEKIRELGRRIGFSIKVNRHAKGGEQLLVVKQKRNDLAHGNFSFSETGRDYSYEQLNAIKKQVVLFLRGIIRNVDTYLNKQQFRVA